MRAQGIRGKLQAGCVGLAMACVFLLGACELIFEAGAVRTHPPEGRMVDVGEGRRIQIDCRGEGAPSVIFQSGGDVLGSLGWSEVMKRLPPGTRACAYSRAGILWSDPAKGPFRPEEVALDLRAALQAAGEAPPYILVSHSRGGLYSLIYAGLFRSEIAGMVFVDSSHPDQEKRFAEAGIAQRAYVSPGQELSLALAWTGLMRLWPYPADPSTQERINAFYPRSAAADAREARARAQSLALAGRYRDLQNWPVVVLAREMPEQTRARREADARDAYLLSSDGLVAGADTPRSEVIWRSLQADLASWSSRGRLEIVPDADHAFFLHRPDVVVAAIEDVLAASRVVRRPPPDVEESPAPFRR